MNPNISWKCGPSSERDFQILESKSTTTRTSANVSLQLPAREAQDSILKVSSSIRLKSHLKCFNLSVRERSTTTAYTEINSLHDLKWPDPPFLVEKLQWGTSLMSEQLENKSLYIKSISLFKHTQHKYTHFRTFTNLQFTSDWRVKGQTNQATSLIFNKPAQVCQIKWSGLLTHAGLESGLPPKKNIKTARFIKLDSLRLTAVHDRKFFREPRSGTWLQSINTAPLVSLCEKLTMNE